MDAFRNDEAIEVDYGRQYRWGRKDAWEQLAEIYAARAAAQQQTAGQQQPQDDEGGSAEAIGAANVLSAAAYAATAVLEQLGIINEAQAAALNTGAGALKAVGDLVDLAGIGIGGVSPPGGSCWASELVTLALSASLVSGPGSFDGRGYGVQVMVSSKRSQMWWKRAIFTVGH